MPIVEKNNFVFAFCRKNRVTSVNCGFKTLVLHPGTSLRSMGGLRTTVILSALVMSVTSASFTPECPKGPGCTNCSNFSSDTIICKKESPNEDSYFSIEYTYSIQPEYYLFAGKIHIRCHQAPSWSDFHLGVYKKLKYVTNIIFIGCDLPRDRKLIKILNQLIDNNGTDVMTYDEYDKDFLWDNKMTLELTNGHFDLSSTLSLMRFALEGFEKYDTITIKNYYLQNLTDELFSANLNNLRTLNLQNNNLRMISTKFFNFSQLNYLDLHINKLQIIENTSFTNLPMLKELNLENNEIKRIESGSFDNNCNLIYLNLVLNHLTTLPPHLFDSLHNLEILELSNNFFLIDSLPFDIFYNNVKLVKIMLDNNYEKNFTLFPEDIFKSGINLKILQFSNNGLRVLPPGLLRNLGKIDDLSLNHNYLEIIPDFFFNNCKKLTYIDLSHNQITHLSAKIFRGLNITSLKMAYNKILYLDLNTFQSTSQLKKVDFTYNGLMFKNSSKFEQGKQLNLSPFHYSRNSIEELNLRGNKITEIYDDWLSAPSIQKLDLSDNQFTYLSHASILFTSFQEFVQVDLTYNKINKIDLHGIDSIQNDSNYSNVELYVYNNPIKCDCSIDYLLRHYRNMTSANSQRLLRIVLNDLKCAGPTELRNVCVDDLNAKSLRCEAPSTCPGKCSCFFRAWDQAHLINCSYRGLTEVPPALDPETNRPVELNLTGNFLKIVQPLNQLGYRNLTLVSLSHNEISSLSLQGWSENLTQLLLHGNNLTQLTIEDMELLANSTKLENLTLHMNPWTCSCDTLDFLNFIQTKQSKFVELRRVTCSPGGTPVFKMSRDDMCPASLVAIIAGGVVIILALIAGILAAVYYRYETEVKVWLFAHQLLPWFVNEAELDRDKIYDAFVSYSHQDEDFVVNTLMPELEGGPRPFKLCIHYRDWLVGEFITEQIAKSVAESRRTVVIVSRNFLESEWGRMEFRTAHSTALSDGRARVIVIIYGEIGPIDSLEPELASYMRTNTYVEWGDRWFWEKLRYALPHH